MRTIAVIFNTCSIKIRLFFVILFPRLRAGHIYTYYILYTPTNLRYLVWFFFRVIRHRSTQFMLQAQVTTESYRNAG